MKRHARNTVPLLLGLCALGVGSAPALAADSAPAAPSQPADAAPATQPQPASGAPAAAAVATTVATATTTTAAQAAPALPDDLPPAVRAYLESLQKQIKDLQDRLNQGPKAATTPPGAVPAPSGPSLIPPVPSARTLTAPLGSRLQFSGYSELRITNYANAFSDRVGPHNSVDFQINRFRPRFVFFMDNNWEADFQMNAQTRTSGNAATNVNARDAYIEYHNGKNIGYAIRLGQQKVPFGFNDYVQGDEPRPALERSRVEEIFVPDERDLGIVASWNPKHLPYSQALLRGPLFAIGVINGNGINRQDNDQSKTVAATARLAVGKHNTIGFSGYDGTNSPSFGNTYAKYAGNIDWESYWGNFRTEMELLKGHMAKHDITGGYGQLEYATGMPGNVFVRYDWYDPAEDLPGDYWNRISIGWYKDFTKNIRITAEYDWVTNELNNPSTHGVVRQKHPNTFGVEVQTNF